MAELKHPAKSFEPDTSEFTPDELRGLLRIGMDSGPGVEAPEAFSRLRVKLEKMPKD